MANVETGETRTERRVVESNAGGGIAETVASVGGVVLAILGLAGVLPLYMMSVSCLVLGAALLFEGATVAARLRRLLQDLAEERSERVEVSGGIAAEAIAGICGIVLGILALLMPAQITLVSIAAIVFGAGMVFGAARPLQRMHYYQGSSVPQAMIESATRDLARVSSGGQLMVGVGAVVLGVLALLGMSPLTLNLVAMLGVGGALMMSGTSLGARMMSALRHY